VTGAVSDTPRLKVSNVSVTFSGNRVLKEVSLQVMPGEIHALIGQNGSGKSTLAKVLSGIYIPDPGASVEVDGRPLRLPTRPLEAREAGVSVVHQTLGLFPMMSVLENMRVGRLSPGRLGRRIDWQAERSAALRAFERLGQSVPLDRKVGALREEDRATVAIARAMQDAERGRGLIIFDESTRALTRPSLQHFYTMLETVISSGTAVLLITHRLEEVASAADKVTILADGAAVQSSVPARGLNEAELTRLMLGRNLEDAGKHPGAAGDDGAASVADSPDSHAAKVVLRGVAGQGVKNLDLDIDPGEIVGVTGLPDSGYHMLPYLLFGAVPARAGTMTIDGTDVKLPGLNPLQALQHGLALVPENREISGLAVNLPVSENLVVAHATKNAVGPTPRRRGIERSLVNTWITATDVRPRAPRMPVRNLSGGNQQKVVLAKWLATAPQFLALHEPTQAVDVGARHTLIEVIRTAAARGCAVLVASSDENELNLLCDRVAIIQDGVVARMLTRDFGPDDIVHAIFDALPNRSLRPPTKEESNA
jgi:ribose transport system ATP-binding protein